jgi:hypothetical protein
MSPTKSIVKALSHVVGYLFDDERDHYESDPGSDHIFIDVCTLSDFGEDLESGKVLLVDAGLIDWLMEVTKLPPKKLVNDPYDIAQRRMEHIRDKLQGLLSKRNAEITGL